MLMIIPYSFFCYNLYHENGENNLLGIRGRGRRDRAHPRLEFSQSRAAGTNINSSATSSVAWDDIIGWLDFYNTNIVQVKGTRLEGYASSSVGDISLDCATTRSGNICGSSITEFATDRVQKIRQILTAHAMRAMLPVNLPVTDGMTRLAGLVLIATRVPITVRIIARAPIIRY